MSTTTLRGAMVFHCDAAKCRAQLNTGTSNFEAARNFARREGWRPTKAPPSWGGGWRHKCAACAAKGEGSQ